MAKTAHAVGVVDSDAGPGERERYRDDPARRFHEGWLGLVQPREGLVFSVPVLADAECHDRHPATLQAQLGRLCERIERQESERQAGLHADKEGHRRVAEVEAVLTQILGFAAADFDHGAGLPADLQLDVQEGPQVLRPTLALRRRQTEPPPDAEGLVPDASTPASRAGARYLMLVWKVRRGLPLDRPEAETGSWAYPPGAKLDRLLRACRVPIGLLSNGDEIRLVYAPAGGASGSVTFRLADMVDPGSDARLIVDAFRNLLGAERFFAVARDRQLPALLRTSRERQADVTKALAGQVLDALGILVQGVERAAERADAAWLDALLARARAEGAVANNELYEGLLTVLLRLVFTLYAEDKGLLPIESRVYEEHYSVHALFDQLQEDHANHPDTMDRRFGAWARLLTLFRAIHGGAHCGNMAIPARHGEVFDPRCFPFLEDAGGRVPAIDDGTVHGVLRELIVLEGQRLSYRALDVEQLGSVYEGMMGFRVERLTGPAVCLRGNRVWVVAKQVLERKPAERAGYLEDEVGVERSVLKKIAAAAKEARTEPEMLAALQLGRAGRIAQAGKGRLVVQPGLERRRTSSHYTPRELTEPVVARALQPLIAAMGGTPSSERLLNLKICDPAMGSGAFLVAACRFLADHVVAGWTREGKQSEVGSAKEDVLLRAKRLVAQRCLYGVDKNPLAVNLAKLSLWLETMAREKPFTFLDHALRNGDSLVGLSLAQIRAFDWNVEGRKQLELPLAAEIDDALKEALKGRMQILELAWRPEVDPDEKRTRLKDVDDALERTALIADLLIGAWWSAEKDKDRDIERLARQDRIVTWLREGGEAPDDLRALAGAQRARVKPFHWMIEFPEIFYAEREDPLDENQRNQVAWMDSFVGNPPYKAGGQLSGMFGQGYLDWLLFASPGAHGNGDLCAHFFRRCFVLLGDRGTTGLIATKTIAEGDTRTTGLQHIVDSGGVIFDAVRSMIWPGSRGAPSRARRRNVRRNAPAVRVSIVHVAKGMDDIVRRTPRRIDGMSVSSIDSKLRKRDERPDPIPLKCNLRLAYLGSKIYGQGFVLTPEERKELIRKNPANGKLIFPYIGGEEVNTSPTQAFDRYVVNFGDMSLEDAERWPDLLNIVRERVKPERDRLSNNPDGRRRKRYWWHFGRVTPALNAALAKSKRCLVNSQVSKHLVFAWEPTSMVFAHTLYAMPGLERAADFAVLQSRVHERWARLLSSSMKADLRYTASDCFVTFPFPDPNRFANSGNLNDIGKRLYDVRATLMVVRNQGLTTTYNQLKDAANRDPAIVELRRLHEEMDRAVLAAYGWSDIGVPPFETPTTAEQRTAFERFNDAVIDRLFALNAERASAEDDALDDPATADTTAPASETDGPRHSPKRAPRKPRATARATRSAKPRKEKAS